MQSLAKNLSEPQLIPFVCPVCEKVIVWAIRGAHCFCPKCNKWIVDRTVLQQKNSKVKS